MVKTAGRGSEGLNASQGSTSQGGGRGQGGRGSRSPAPGRGSSYQRRSQNPIPRTRPNGFLTALLGHSAHVAHATPDHRTPASGPGSSSRMPLVVGDDRRGLAAICEAVDHIEGATTSTPLAALPKDERKETKVAATTNTTAPLVALPTDERKEITKAAATTNTTAPLAALPNDERKETKVAATTNTTAPPTALPDDEREEGEIVEDTDDVETRKYILPDLNLPPPEDPDFPLPDEQ